MLTCAYVYTQYIHTYIYTYIHTYIHTFTLTCASLLQLSTQFGDQYPIVPDNMLVGK